MNREEFYRHLDVGVGISISFEDCKLEIFKIFGIYYAKNNVRGEITEGGISGEAVDSLIVSQLLSSKLVTIEYFIPDYDAFLNASCV